MNIIPLVLILFQPTRAFIYVRNILLNATVADIYDAASTFGPSVPESGFAGFFVFAEPIDACSTLRTPTGATFRTDLNSAQKGSEQKLDRETPKIVVIRRGNCTFYDKVLRAQRANYSFAIVYNNAGDDIMRMNTNGIDDILIPSVFIGKTDGSSLKMFPYKRGYYLFIVPTIVFPVLYYIVPFVVLIFAVLATLLVGIMFKCLFDWKRKRRTRLSPSNLRKIPVKKFVKGVDHYETCAICLEDYVDGVKIRILPCSHAFHSKKCIDPWLLRNRRTCPICKLKILLPGDQPTSGEDEEEGNSQSVNPAGFSNSPHGDLSGTERSPLLNTRSASGDAASPTLPGHTVRPAVSETRTSLSALLSPVHRSVQTVKAFIQRRNNPRNYEIFTEESPSQGYGANEETTMPVSSSAYENEIAVDDHEESSELPRKSSEINIIVTTSANSEENCLARDLVL